MNIAIKESQNNIQAQELVKDLYLAYSVRLLNYTLKNYRINEEDARNLVYKTIYRMAETSRNYTFENDQKKTAFVFKTHINYLKNHFRDNKVFENLNFEIDLKEFEQPSAGGAEASNPKLRLLQKLLDKMEDWQRILLLMRGQDIPYSEISKYVDKPEKQLKLYYSRLKHQLMTEMNEVLKTTDPRSLHQKKEQDK